MLRKTGDDYIAAGDFVGARAVLERAADAGRAPMALSTEFLQVTPNAHRIQTDRGVTVRQAGSSIEAGAMLAEGEEPVVRFSQKVKSVYERSR